MASRHALLPFLAALAGVAMLSLMDAFMKGASLAVGAYSASLLRSAIGTLLIAPVWLARERRMPAPPVLRLHLLRGFVTTFMALSFFYALTKLPIAETIAISFVAPLIGLYLAALFLGESITRPAVIASLLGFAGTLVIVGGRLGNVENDTAVLKGLAAILFSAVLYACNFILIRKQALVASPVEAATFHSGVSAVVLGLAAPWLLTLPDSGTLGQAACAAALTVGGSMAITWAYARSEAQKLIPLEYSGFLWAALFGWLFFAEAVTVPTMAGVVLIVAGCWIAAPRKSTEPVQV